MPRAQILGSLGQEIEEVRIYGGGAGGSSQVEGVDADQDAATARPVGVGGIYSVTQPTYTDLDRTNLQTDNKGTLKVALYTGSNAISNTNGVQVQGTYAIDAPIGGSPVYIGGRASSATPTAVSADGDAQALWVGRNGQTVIGSVNSTPVDNTPNAAARFANVDGSFSPLQVMPYIFDGGLWDLPRTPTTFKPQSAVAIATEATVWTPAAGKKFRLMGGLITSSVTGDIIFRDNTAGTIIAVVPTIAGAPTPIFGDPPGNGILSAVANNVLTADGPALSTLSGTIFGTEE